MFICEANLLFIRPDYPDNAQGFTRYHGETPEKASAMEITIPIGQY
jgi:hypothetical protein